MQVDVFQAKCEHSKCISGGSGVQAKSQYEVGMRTLQNTSRYSGAAVASLRGTVAGIDVRLPSLARVRELEQSSPAAHTKPRPPSGLVVSAAQRGDKGGPDCGPASNRSRASRGGKDERCRLDLAANALAHGAEDSRHVGIFLVESGEWRQRLRRFHPQVGAARPCSLPVLHEVAISRTLAMFMV
jgi:hypothetical protein